MKLRNLFFMLPCLVSQMVLAQTDWLNIKTVDEVCAAYPEQIRSIFLNLNLKYTGLEEVKKACDNNNIPLACQNLLDYYGKSSRVLKDLPMGSQQAESRGSDGTRCQ